MTDNPAWYIVPKEIEDIPQARLRQAIRILDGIETPARMTRIKRIRFVIKKLLEGEPSAEQAQSVIDRIYTMIWNK